MKKIIILDFQSGKAYIRPVPDNMTDQEAEDVLVYFADILNLSIDDCEYTIINSNNIDIE